MKEIKPAILMLIAFTIICGGLYPAIVTGIAQAVFPKQANGSFITNEGGQVLGSSLIGQPFSAPKYFWPRPSSTPDFAYNPAGSSGSNSGPTNPAYLETVADRVKRLRAAGLTGPVPAELVQASASGLDPHITPEAAKLQITRVAKARGMSDAELTRLVAGNIEDRQFGFFGEPRVNVLELNLKLDALK
ncbi:MAG: potassium-transporting ATPase subunit KdpC [Deltaproteobacteria bacterium]|nr:potassium-transporting ATPase subunit KdpC [Deltaproteobacteria bacterium]TLN00921.1 MAG: potassium-transporting ATPase subunit KdpC [bacterium]